METFLGELHLGIYGQRFAAEKWLALRISMESGFVLDVMGYCSKIVSF